MSTAEYSSDTDAEEESSVMVYIMFAIGGAVLIGLIVLIVGKNMHVSS